MEVASNPGAVVPGALVPGEFGSGCALPCEISKRSKYVETIPHIEIYIYVIYCMVEMGSSFMPNN